MKTKKISVWLVISLAAVLCAGTVRICAAADEHEKMGKKQEEKFDAMVRELNLTPEQQERLSKQRQAQRTDAAAVREQMRVKRQELKVELDKPTTDRAKVDALTAEMEKLMGQGMRKRVDGVLELKEILSPEQFKSLNDKLEASEGKGRKGKRR